MNNLRDDESKNLKGVVTMYKDGELVFQKHNMIVNSGRQFIKDIFERRAFVSDMISTLDENTETLENYKFYKIYFGKTGVNNIITTPELELSTIKGKTDEEASKSIAGFRYLYNGGTVSERATIWSNVKDRYLRFSIELSGTFAEQISVSEIFISIAPFDYATDTFILDAENSEKLFSRVVFDPEFIGTGSTYKLEYVIYF